MAAYTIINSTGSALATASLTTPAYTIQTGITLTDPNLALACALDGVAVMQDAATAAEITAVGDLIIDGTGAAPGTSTRVANGTSGTVGGVAAYSLADAAAKKASEIHTLLATSGVVVAKGAITDALKEVAAGVLVNGKVAGYSTT